MSPKRHWLQVAAPIGTKIRVGDQIGEISVGNGYASGQPAVAHFGLGDLTEVDVTIGKVTKRVSADQVLKEVQIWKFDLPDRGTGTLWSSWGDGIVASDGKYYTAIGDHRDMVKVFVLDGGLREVFSLEEKGHGKIHAALHEWKGGIWFATYWGKSKELPDGWGGYLYRHDLSSGKTEKVGMLEAGRGFPASTMLGGRIYFHSVDPDEGGELLVYDLEQRKVVFTGGGDLMEGKRAFLTVDDRVYFSTKNQTLAYWDGKGIVESALRIPGPTLRASAGPFGFTQKGKLFRVDGDKVVELHDEAEYIAVMVTDGTHLYYAPGAHGSSTRAGSPVVRYEIATGKRTVLCKLNGLVKDYVIGGTYNLKLGKGALYGTFNGGRGKETFGEPCVVRIPLQ